MISKGIILAGGTGSRLSPLTKSVNKQLLPVYDKPLIFYPLSVLMLADIKDVLIIVNAGQINSFKKILGNGSSFGIKITYKEQKKPNGLPEAFKIGEKFIGKSNVALILGDNFFYGQSLSDLLVESKVFKEGSVIFLKSVKKPSSYGVAKIINNKITQIVEKPKKFVSDQAITGLYYFDNKVIKFTKQLKASRRGETEITDLIKIYHKNNQLTYKEIGRGAVWSDAGKIEDLTNVSNFVASVEKMQSYKIGCLEEIALNKKWITKNIIKRNIKSYGQSNYSIYLQELLKI
jgi:glucose-1-phosphate thymidylyltransferase